MSVKPLICFGIPAYNCAETISRTINSIVNCGIRDFEIVCVNDASSDNTIDVLTKMAKEDPRIKVISNKRNLGILISRAIIAKQSTGLLFTWVDSDDCLLPSFKNLVDRYLEKIINGSMLIHDAYIAKVGSHEFSRLYSWSHDRMVSPNQMFFRAALAEGIGAYPWSFITTSSNVKLVYDKLRFSRDYIDDQLVFYKYFSVCDEVYLSGEITYVHYLSDGSDSHKRDFFGRLSRTYKFESEQPELQRIKTYLIGKMILNDKYYQVSNNSAAPITISKSESIVLLRCILSKHFSIKTKLTFLFLIVFPNLFRLIFSRKRRY